uniref:DUF4057 domain-containing protein n=1 Tax=Angiostrongylus cantonensis TaxID=6313 RepID=A0A0K0DJI8_ANGCA
MPKDKDDEAFTHNQATTKSRIREPWTVEYFLNKPQNLDKPLLKTVVDAKVGSKKKMRKKHHYKMTNKGKGKENCVIGSSALSEDGNDLEHNTVDGLPTDNFEHGQPDISGAMAVRKDSDGYAISSAEKPTSPLAQEFVDVRSRHSLPLSRSVFEETKWSTESYNQSLDGNAKTSPGHPSNTSFAVCGAIKKQQNIKTRPDDVSLAKALGSRSCKLHATRRMVILKVGADGEKLGLSYNSERDPSRRAMPPNTMDKTDDFDEILNSISLHDGSLVTFDDEQAPNGSK